MEIKIFTVTQFCSVVEMVHLKPEVLLNSPSIYLTYFRNVLTESSEYKRQSKHILIVDD